MGSMTKWAVGTMIRRVDSLQTPGVPVPVYASLINLVDRRLNSSVVGCSDEFFAACENLLEPQPAVFDAERFTDDGKWMDGWESRRRRIPGHDWAVLKLGAPGVVVGADIDCAYFVGNCPESAWLEGCWAPDATDEQLLAGSPEHSEGPDLNHTSAAPVAEGDEVNWFPITQRVTIAGGKRNFAQSQTISPITHVRLHIDPDGGVARLRLHGHVLCDWDRLCDDAVEVNLAAAELGASAVYANDSFFGHHDNLLVPTLPRNMGEGWETRRRRGPAGFDWVVIKLAGPGRVDRVVVDTMFFKGNYPATVAIDLALLEEDPKSWAAGTEKMWTEALPESPLTAHAAHEFQFPSPAVATHVRMRIAPDGGVARLRVFGVPVPHTIAPVVEIGGA